MIALPFMNVLPIQITQASTHPCYKDPECGSVTNTLQNRYRNVTKSRKPRKFAGQNWNNPALGTIFAMSIKDNDIHIHYNGIAANNGRH